MPKVSKGEIALAQKGNYILLLREIECRKGRQTNDRGQEHDSPFWIWYFAGFIERDTERNIVSVEITTGVNVTRKDSALKHLLMSAYPNMTLDDMQKFDTDEMINKLWRVKVGIGQKPDGSDKNIILNIEPFDGMTVKEFLKLMDEKDPDRFADDDD